MSTDTHADGDMTYLSSNSVTPGGEELRNTRGVEASFRQTESRTQTGTARSPEQSRSMSFQACADYAQGYSHDDSIVLVLNERVLAPPLRCAASRVSNAATGFKCGAKTHLDLLGLDRVRRNDPARRS